MLACSTRLVRGIAKQASYICISAIWSLNWKTFHGSLECASLRPWCEKPLPCRGLLVRHVCVALKRSPPARPAENSRFRRGSSLPSPARPTRSEITCETKASKSWRGSAAPVAWTARRARADWGERGEGTHDSEAYRKQGPQGFLQDAETQPTRAKRFETRKSRGSQTGRVEGFWQKVKNIRTISEGSLVWYVLDGESSS